MSEELLGSLISGTVVAVGATGFYFLFKWMFSKKRTPAPVMATGA